VGRGEDRPHLWDVGLDCITQSEAIRRGEIDFGDDEVAGTVGIDPFNGFVGSSCGSRCRPTEFGDHLREVCEFRRIIVNNENLHFVWLLR
jgi:hypothetical protein